MACVTSSSAHSMILCHQEGTIAAKEENGNVLLLICGRHCEVGQSLDAALAAAVAAAARQWLLLPLLLSVGIDARCLTI